MHTRRVKLGKDDDEAVANSSDSPKGQSQTQPLRLQSPYAVSVTLTLTASQPRSASLSAAAHHIRRARFVREGRRRSREDASSRNGQSSAAWMGHASMLVTCHGDRRRDWFVSVPWFCLHHCCCSGALPHARLIAPTTSPKRSPN